MLKRVAIFLLLLSIQGYVYAQQADSTSNSHSNSTGFIFKPTIGLGTGMFSYYGDIYDKHFQAPMVSRIGYELNVSQRFTDYLQFNFYVLFGKLGANERLSENNRNLNFESQIRVGGVNLLYNFGNFLPKTRNASPYISLGIESFEFLSKTDLLDANGNRYYYWSDGSTRSLDEHDPMAASAVILHRDYTYESDIRESNLDGFGKYPERSWAVPVGVGFLMKINDYWDFKFGTAMHFTFTDYIDGVSEKSTGNRVGNSKNDNFMMTSFSLHYNLGLKGKNGSSEEMDNDRFKDVDFFALDLEDTDKDGVPDSKDSCQGTPAGVPVDAKGCPLDDDNDNVPNYKDDELNSPAGAFVDVKGVQLTDSIIDYQYRYYMDSTGAFATVEYHDHNGRYSMVNQNAKEYTVDLGTFKNGLSPDLMTKFLSIGDISSTNLDDSTTLYTAGKFNNLLDAEKRKKQLKNDGLSNAKVIYKQNGKYFDAPLYGSANYPNNTNSSGNNSNGNNTVANNNNSGNNSNTGNNNGSQTTNNNVGNSTGNNTNNNVANNNVTNNVSNNSNSTNTTGNNSTNNNSANNNTATTNNTNSNNSTGNNTSNNSTNNTAVNNNTSNNTSNNSTTHSTSDNSSINNKGVVLRVQLGAYHRRLSKSVFRDITDLIEIKTEDGLYKYMTGSFTTFDAAAKHKVEMLLKGYQGAFITAYKDGKRVSLEEAGATPSKKDDMIDVPDNNAVNAVNKKLVTFKIQVGVFKSDPPADIQEKLNKVKGISKENTGSGLNRYVTGSYNDYSQAQNAKNDLVKTTGLTDAFVVAFYDGQYISIQEALELLK